VERGIDAGVIFEALRSFFTHALPTFLSGRSGLGAGPAFQRNRFQWRGGPGYLRSRDFARRRRGMSTH
jgi:hypothetical protein